ncbi:DUF4221 family protein [Echinicola sp. CAU 1574]|uniref:DUF4221 family protein n=1 Tax=Echinicola arenosa TaxID=2774144 RepID=A0ABR9AGW4_9BACT|nr:DUF4221 family protein [Echinicola arenosa]MBD8487981.1 DUF4221 family protein [Echinicola arenosa]
MKTIHIWLLLVLLIACKEKDNHSHTASITYDLDTLVIDSKGEILDLKYQLDYSGMDGNFLYNFNHFEHKLEVIDLEKGVLINKIPFQKEGPNGTGTNFTSFQLFDKNKLLISNGFYNAKIFDLNGKAIEKINLKNTSWKGQTLNDSEIIRKKIFLNQSSAKLFTIAKEEGPHSTNRADLAVFDFKNNLIKRLSIDPHNKIKTYSLISEDNSFLPPLVYLSIENALPLISHEFTNEIYWFDTTTNQIKTVDYSSKSTLDEVNSQQEHHFKNQAGLLNAYENMLTQIRFGPVVFDDKNKKYYRFSCQYEFSENPKDKSIFPEIKNIKTYLTVFQKDFQVEHELLIPELNYKISHYFVKDGKLWIFHNINDELTFIRLTPLLN